MKDVVISQDFFPQIGGAHLWLYEVYRRWSSPVAFLTRPYASTPAEASAQADFDSKPHGALKIVRADIAVDEINLLSRTCRARFSSVAKRLRALAAGDKVTIHCLRAFPEGVSGLLVKVRHPRTTRLVVYAHGEEILVAHSSRQLRFLASLVYRFADLVVANSRNTLDLVKAISPRARVVCIHPGVDAAAYVRAPEQLEQFRRQWGWPPETIIVSTISRMEPRKNQAAVIAAVAALRKAGLPLGYICAGDGSERSRLVSLARELDIEAWVAFPGAITDEQKILIFGASHVHALPSIQVGEMIEGFGIVFLEAAAAGTPSVCGSIGGQPEAVADGETGIVVDGTAPAQVEKALRTLATDPALRSRMGQAAVARAVRQDWNNVARSIADLVAAPQV